MVINSDLVNELKSCDVHGADLTLTWELNAYSTTSNRRSCDVRRSIASLTSNITPTDQGFNRFLRKAQLGNQLPYELTSELRHLLIAASVQISQLVVIESE